MFATGTICFNRIIVPTSRREPASRGAASTVRALRVNSAVGAGVHRIGGGGGGDGLGSGTGGCI